MTIDQTRLLRKYASTVAVFFALAVLVILGKAFFAPRAESAIRESAQSVLASWSDAPPELGDRITGSLAGLSYEWTFTAISRGKSVGIVFVTSITGNSGPVTGVFVYTPGKGTEFCGLAGVRGSQGNLSRYGITERVLTGRISRLNTIASGLGESK